MIKAFYRLLDYKMLILLLMMFIASPLLCGQNTYTVCLIYSHYLTVYIHNVYLLMLYQYSSRVNALASYFITRIGEEKFYIYGYLAFFTIGIIYTFIIYIGYYFFFGAIPKESLSITILFMILNLIVTCIENSLIYMQIGQKKNFLYLAGPILINFIFHILFTKLF